MIFVVSRLSVVTAYVAFAFVGAIVLGVYLSGSRHQFTKLKRPAVGSFQPPGVFMRRV